MNIKGFIDLHTHGIARYDTASGKYTDILKMSELHGIAGTGGLLPTIYPGPIEVMREQIEAVRKAMTAQNKISSSLNPEKNPAAVILGVHLEGPFLNPAMCGALDKESFVRPGIASLKDLVKGFEDIIKIITVAPELPGALKVIEQCCLLGIRVNMGHSDATFKQAVEGKKAGATGITHMFNAMRPFHHREPGLAGLGLLDEDMYTEVIADGFHLHEKTLELIFNRKRLDRIILVSDSVKNRGEGRPVRKKGGIIAGSSITLKDTFPVLRNLGIPEAEIIEAAIDNPLRHIRHSN